MKKILCFLLVIVLAVSAVGCSFVGTRKVTTDNIQESGQNEQQVKTYNSMDEYVADRMSQKTTVTYYSISKYNASPDGGANACTATANVIDTKLILLEKKGEVIGLAADGVLECWEYKYLIKPDVPIEDIMMVDEAVDGWWDMAGEGNRTTVVLRSPEETYTVLRDEMVNDGIDFTRYCNSYEEAIHDWYVTEYGLDLPLYVQDWTDEITMPDGEYIGNQPVHRFDGDGWSVYIPVAAWYQSTDAEENQWLWRSSYNTGSTLIVDMSGNALDDEYVTAEKQGYTPIDDTNRVWELYKDGTHSYYYYYENPNGGFWRLTIRWMDEGVSSDNPNVAIEPQLLKLMAEKFVVYETEINVSLDAEHGPFIGYVADAETPWIDLYTEKNGTYVGRIPYEIFHDWVATDRSSESWTPGWMNEYIHFYYAEFGDFRWAAAHLTNTVLGSGRKNVATSSDSGETWNVGSTSDDYGGNHVAGMGFISDKIAFMSFDPYNEYEGTDGPVISRTIDGGKTWERLEISVPESLKGKKLISGIPFYDGEVLRYPVWNSPSHGTKSEDAMYLVSYDNGMSWEWERAQVEEGGTIYFTSGVIDQYLPPEATNRIGNWSIGNALLLAFESDEIMPCVYQGFLMDAQTYAVLKTQFELPMFDFDSCSLIRIAGVDNDTAQAVLRFRRNNGSYTDIAYELGMGVYTSGYEPNAVTVYKTPTWAITSSNASFDPGAFAKLIPNESATVEFHYRIFMSQTYLYFCSLGSAYVDGSSYMTPPNDFAVYYVDANRMDEGIGYIEAELPADLEYDSVFPVFATVGGGSLECRFYLCLTNNGETFYVEFNNFAYKDPADYLKFEYAGIVSNTELANLAEQYPDSFPIAQQNINTTVEQQGQLVQSILENQTMLYDTSAKQEMLLSDWLKKTEYAVSKYSVIDLNGDSDSEMVLWLTRGANEYVGFLILHSEGDRIYAHLLYYRQFMELKEDGTFSFSGGVSNHGIGRIDFAGDTYTITKIAYCESEDNQQVSFFIDGESVSQDDFSAYESAQSQKQNAVWCDYEIGN